MHDGGAGGGGLAAQGGGHRPGLADRRRGVAGDGSVEPLAAAVAEQATGVELFAAAFTLMDRDEFLNTDRL